MIVIVGANPSLAHRTQASNKYSNVLLDCQRKTSNVFPCKIQPFPDLAGFKETTVVCVSLDSLNHMSLPFPNNKDILPVIPTSLSSSLG